MVAYRVAIAIVGHQRKTSSKGVAVASGASQRMSLSVNAGLYVLRYLGGGDLRNSPRASVRPAATSMDDIDVIGAPGTDLGDMPGPGSSLVLVVRKAGSVDVTVHSLAESATLDAKFSLDLLATAKSVVVEQSRQPSATKALAPQENGSANSVGDSLALEFSAHVARRGDISADAEGWIAGPRAPSAIEGIALRCLEARVDIMAQFMNGQTSGRWSDWEQPGAFVGTRQKASPLTGLRLRLSGADAQRFEIEADALFLGSPLVNRRGSEVELISSGGVDPLVGLKVSLVPLAAQVSDIADAKRSRVRVFR